MEKLLLILLLGIASCKESKYEIYIYTSSSDGSRSGHHRNNGTKVNKDTYMFIFRNEPTGVTDTTFVQIKKL